MRRSAPYSLIALVQRVLLALRGAQLPDHERCGGVTALHRRGDAQQVVPHVRDQVPIQSSGKQRTGAGVAVQKVGARSGPVQGDLPEVPDPR